MVKDLIRTFSNVQDDYKGKVGVKVTVRTEKSNWYSKKNYGSFHSSNYILRSFHFIGSL